MRRRIQPEYVEVDEAPVVAEDVDVPVVIVRAEGAHWARIRGDGTAAGCRWH